MAQSQEKAPTKSSAASQSVPVLASSSLTGVDGAVCVPCSSWNRAANPGAGVGRCQSSVIQLLCNRVEQSHWFV